MKLIKIRVRYKDVEYIYIREKEIEKREYFIAALWGIRRCTMG